MQFEEQRPHRFRELCARAPGLVYPILNIEVLSASLRQSIFSPGLLAPGIEAVAPVPEPHSGQYQWGSDLNRQKPRIQDLYRPEFTRKRHLCENALPGKHSSVRADVLPMLRTGTLVGASLRAHSELARWLVHRTSHKRRAQAAECLPPYALPCLRQAI